jgi:hypothetical protein
MDGHITWCYASRTKIDPFAFAHSDTPLQAPFAHGFVIVAKNPPSVSRHLTWYQARR